MLDADTKRQIDTLRDILVGKIPNPQSQVEQITTGLIYKFMDDMDQESVELGGEKSFFTGDYEKYAWKNLFDPKLGGSDKVKLYSEAVESMYLNPTAPQLFREIFKNAFLPFKDSSTLNMFLKEIDEFHYSHSEKLGDAFEYLLSFMGSQGDAGQFRTPRHIIDFIVEIVDPQKHESVLDPSCGSAGFLISSYKHILKNNTDKRLGDKLSSEDRKKVGNNLNGYDISPEMIRLSLVNMYLHGFQTPKIEEYDTLSSEDKWNEYYDVILANPPFFSPKGGIQPHNRFGVSSKKAEVLFTSYILDHLKPDGRAGIIVPEGIIFQTGTAYLELRKQLIENGLIGVISLPAGVFQPYSGVKTSILILNKKLYKEKDSIFFVDVKNDGFSLGAQRTALDTSDLPKLSKDIVELNQNELIEHVKKQTLLDNKDFSLTLNRYIEATVLSGIYDFVPLSEVSSILNGHAFKSKEMQDEINTGDLPVLKIGNITQDGNISEKSIQFHQVENNLEKFIVSSKDIVIAMTGATVGKVAEIKTGKYLLNQRVSCLRSNNKINRNYLRYLLISDRFYNFCQMGAEGGAQGNISSADLEKYKIPLPPLEVQQEIVDELEGYQKIIDGCKQVVENYKPTLDIDPSWEMVELGEVATTQYGTSNKSSDTGKVPVLRMGNLQNGEIEYDDLVFSDDEEDISKFNLEKGDILFNRTNSPELVGKTSIFRGYESQIIFAGYLVRVKVNKEKIFPEYLNSILNSHYGEKLNNRNVSISGNQANINASKLAAYPIPIPSLDIQEEIVQKIEEERKVIEGNKKLIEIYTQKIQNRINKVWGED